MNAGGVTSRVYDALKRDVMSGRLTPGLRLDPAKLAETLVSSTTPVRDALYQLVGERLVETRASEGFFLPQMHEPALRDRYGWIAALFRLAAERWPPAPTMPLLDLPSDYEAAARAVFDAAAARTGSREHERQMSSANDRLAASRRAEERAMVDPASGLVGLARAVAAGDRRAALKASTDFHRRRQRAVPDILAAMYRL